MLVASGPLVAPVGKSTSAYVAAGRGRASEQPCLLPGTGWLALGWGRKLWEQWQVPGSSKNGTIIVPAACRLQLCGLQAATPGFGTQTEILMDNYLSQ